MKQLLAIAWRQRSYRPLFISVIIFMCLATIGSQLEIFALGLMSKKGVDFFELFQPHRGGADQVSIQEINSQWPLIANGRETLSKQEAQLYLTNQRKGEVINGIMAQVDQTLGLTNNLFLLALFLIGISLFKALTMFGHRFLTRVTAIRISADLRQSYFEHIQSLPMSFFQKHHIGHLSSRVAGDATQVAEAINACLVNYLQTPFTVFSTLILCFLTSWQLSLIVFIGSPALILPILLLAKRVKRISKQILKNQEHFAAVLIDFLAGVQTVKVFAMENFSLTKYREQNSRLEALERKSARYDLSTRPIIHMIGMLFLATTLLYGLYVLHMGISEVLFFCGMLYVFYEPIKKFAEENTHIQKGVAAAERIAEVMSVQSHIQDRKEASELKGFHQLIEFDHVWFKYEDRWILEDVSFTIRAGETVAIVGPTGSGKSTLVQLLPRLYEPTKGQIRIDGQPIDAYTQRSLRDQIAFVPQKPFLFLDTIAANIAFGRQFSEVEIERAAKRAHAIEFIERLPERYHTFLDEAGKNLSGGQQQRLAIARALVKEAPILIFDEATSALDNVSERAIKDALHELRGEITQILIAHRLSTIEDADRIFYFERGRLIAQGTRDELLESCPGFKAMWELSRAEPGVDTVLV